ncbi:BfmA/BtgA family mobilization protein [Hymenobacter sp. UYP22]|uniref:BfmA/BtgA family mobilization protein n=1 Tax=Hymenobacter sp. UYP22 TaxID=3156348 RepID=UPI00339A020E
MTSKVKTIAADAPAYEAFRQLAKEYQLSNPELLAAMVQYFRVTKADPRQPTGPDLTTSLAKLTAKLDQVDKRTIGFIREQEKTYLKPLLADVQGLREWTAAPIGLTGPQLTEMEHWLTAVVRKGFKPEYRHPNLLSAAAPSYDAFPELAPLRKVCTSVLGRELNPAQFIPRAPAPTPAAATLPPPASPNQPA